MGAGSEDLPRHIAVIMDGNGRWAKKRLMPRTMGHRAGMSALKRVVKAMVELNIPYLTVFAFSTENWRRPSEEVDYLMNLLVEYLLKELGITREQYKNQYWGLSLIAPAVTDGIEAALKKTRNNSGLTFSIALNYGAWHEILTAVRKLSLQWPAER